MIKRAYNADFINSVINDPSVKEGAEVKGIGDLSVVVSNLENFVLQTEFGGFVGIKKMQGLYECHTQFLPEGRGAHAMEACKEALRYMFLKTDCARIVTKASVSNRATQFMAAQFFKKRGQTGEHFYYSLDFDEWVLTDALCNAEGEKFHALVEDTTNHAEDKTHDSFVGAAWLMIQSGNIYKAQFHYSKWAFMSGYEPMIILAESPLIIQAGSMRLALENGELVCQ